MGPDASLTPELIQAQSFTTAFRGCDPAEVRSFLNRVATELRAWRERAEQLESAWHSAEERAARPPVLDEDTLMAAVGEETASILRSARAAAADMRAKAAEESERMLADARTESERLVTHARSEAEKLLEEARTEADKQRSDATAESDKLMTEARSESQRLLEEARAEAGRVRTAAEDAAARTAAGAEDAAARLMSGARSEAAEILERSRIEAEAVRAAAEKDRHLTIDGATTTRDRILADLARRRRIATVQIEQLRAGRERLIESYAVVRRTLEEASAELSRADTEARAAADEVGRRMNEDPDLVADTGPPGPDEGDEPLVVEDILAAGDPVGEAGGAADRADGPAQDVSAAAEVSVEAESDDHPDPPEAEAVRTGGEAEAAAAGDTPLDTGEAQEGSEPETQSQPGIEPPPEPGMEAEGASEPTEQLETAPDPDGSGEPAASAVDELFARIRATRTPDRAPAQTDTEAEAEEVVAGDEAGEDDEYGEGAGEPGETDDDDEKDEGDDDEEGTRLSDLDESLLQRRESAVVDLEVTLTRRLKRALQDEQNDVLDRLRNLKGEPTVERLLSEPSAQTARYVEAARPLLVQAAAAGVAFAAALGGTGASVAEPDVEDLAGETGTGIVEALRRRLEQVVARNAGDEQAVLVEALGAAYREWKTQRIERLAGDVLSAAFSRGTWQAAPEGAVLRWIVEDTDGPCPDCDDDALAGELPKGEAFPTGQHHPPAHSGCRCLLVPGPPAG